MRRKPSALARLIFVLLALLVALVPGAPVSGDAPDEESLPAHANPGPRRPVRNTPSTSTNWAGYGVAKNLGAVSGQPNSGNQDSVNSVRASWTVPNLGTGCAGTGANGAYSAIWVGIDGYHEHSPTVQQIGTGQDCSGNAPIYYAWYEMYPKIGVKIRNFVVQPNDVIDASVTYTGNGYFNLSITNVTRSKTYQTSQRNAKALRESAEFIVEWPTNGVLPLAPINTVSFSNAQVNISGAAGPIDGRGWCPTEGSVCHDPITLVNGSTTLTPSSLVTFGTGTAAVSAFNVCRGTTCSPPGS